MEPRSNDIVKEVTLEQMCTEIFSKPPKKPRSNVIQIHETCSEDIPINEEGEYVFEMLQTILFTGIATAFPECIDDDGKRYINLSMLTMNNFEKLKEYFRSMGYDICMEMIPLTEEQIALFKHDPKSGVKNIFSTNRDTNDSDDLELESCKCGWIKSKNKAHFSDYKLHFVRNDNLGISLHFILY
jgi:hypothetical protein